VFIHVHPNPTERKIPMTHTQKTIAEISKFKGPAEGTLLVLLSWGRYDALMGVADAIKEVRDNPRIEYSAEERWLIKSTQYRMV
jgi:hypothetical protein